jgi:hypothetical protein
MATQTLDNMVTWPTDDTKTQTIDMATLSRLALEYNKAHPMMFFGLQDWQIGLILLAIIAIWAVVEGGLWGVARGIEYFNHPRKEGCGRSCQRCHEPRRDLGRLDERNEVDREVSFIAWESDDEDVEGEAVVKLRDDGLDDGKQDSRIRVVLLRLLQFLTWPYSCPCQRSCVCRSIKEPHSEIQEIVIERAAGKVKDEEKGLLAEY